MSYPVNNQAENRDKFHTFVKTTTEVLYKAIYYITILKNTFKIND